MHHNYPNRSCWYISRMNMHGIKFRFSLTFKNLPKSFFSLFPILSLTPQSTHCNTSLYTHTLSPPRMLLRFLKTYPLFISSDSSSLWHLSGSSQIKFIFPFSVLLECFPQLLSELALSCSYLCFSPALDLSLWRAGTIIYLSFYSLHPAESLAQAETNRKFISLNNLMTCP